VQRICRHCSQSVAATDEEMRLFEAHGLLQEDDPKQSNEKNFRSFLKAKIDGRITVTRGTGCRLCDQTGFQGRMAISEVMEADEPLRQLILQGCPAADLERNLERSRFKPMLYDGLWKVREGLAVTDDILKAVQRAGIST